MLGHNNPPAIEAHSLTIAELLELANGITTVETAEQEAAADQLLDDLRKAKKAADDARKTEKQPHLDASKAVDDAYRAPIRQADVATDHLKAVLTPYRAMQQSLKDAEAKRLRDEALAASQAAQKAFESDDLNDRAGAEDELKRARIASAQANKIGRTATGLRTHWQAEVTDRRAALNHYIRTQPEAFAELIQTLADRDARGTRAPVPGVIFHERKIAA